MNRADNKAVVTRNAAVKGIPAAGIGEHQASAARVSQDPRYWQQIYRREFSAAQVDLAPALFKKAFHRDWAVNLGTGATLVHVPLGPVVESKISAVFVKGSGAECEPPTTKTRPSGKTAEAKL